MSTPDPSPGILFLFFLVFRQGETGCFYSDRVFLYQFVSVRQARVLQVREMLWTEAVILPRLPCIRQVLGGKLEAPRATWCNDSDALTFWHGFRRQGYLKHDARLNFLRCRHRECCSIDISIYLAI